jgi:hypothetical protein
MKIFKTFPLLLAALVASPCFSPVMAQAQTYAEMQAIEIDVASQAVRPANVLTRQGVVDDQESFVEGCKVDPALPKAWDGKVSPYSDRTHTLAWNNTGRAQDIGMAMIIALAKPIDLGEIGLYFDTQAGKVEEDAGREIKLAEIQVSTDKGKTWKTVGRLMPSDVAPDGFSNQTRFQYASVTGSFAKTNRIRIVFNGFDGGNTDGHGWPRVPEVIALEKK